MAGVEEAERTPPAASGGSERFKLRKLRKQSLGLTDAANQAKDNNNEADAYRNKILAELLSTERSYITSLDQLTNVIKMLRGAPNDIISSKQTARLASNTDMLLNFHRSGLLPQLENLIGRKVPDVNVGSVIISFMPFLKATYAQFVNNYSFAIATLKELVATPRFMTFVSANWKADGPGSSFESYVDLRLITPVQRIPRYELLLKDLLRHTPNDHLEFTTLTEAYNKVKEVAEFVNEKKAEAERMQQLLSLQSSLREDQHRQSIVLAQPGRFLISETRVTVHRKSQLRTASAGETALSHVTLGAISPNAPSEGKIIMFNDCVLVARKKSASAERLTFSALLYIKPLVVQDLGGLDFTLHAEKDALRSSIVKEGKTFRFSAVNDTQKAQLLTAIQDAKTLLSTKEASAKRLVRPRLHLAIKQGDMNAIQEVVKNDPNSVHAMDRKGQTALHAAVKKHDPELAKYLLSQGANTKAMAHDGLSPVDLATKLGDEAMLSVLQPKLRTGKQDETQTTSAREGFISGVAGAGMAVGSVVGKGLFMPLRMFKKEDSASALPSVIKREPSTSASDPASPAAGTDEASPEKDKSGDLKKDGSRRSLISIPLLSRSDKDNKDKESRSVINLLPHSAGSVTPISPKKEAPPVTDEDRIKAITLRIGDIDLHMVALAQEKTALLEEMRRLQPAPPPPPHSPQSM